MPLFHCTTALLGTRSTILPGNYGWVIRKRGESHQHWKREQELEAVRVASYPSKPSRLDSTYSFVSEDTARFFRERFTAEAHIYLVEKVDQKVIDHHADFNVVQPLSGRPENHEQIAHLYWTAKLWITIAEHPEIRCEEVVSSSPLRILERID